MSETKVGTEDEVQTSCDACDGDVQQTPLYLILAKYCPELLQQSLFSDEQMLNGDYENMMLGNEEGEP